jgi:transcriptional regulator of acetoin/glycerol metabolism
MAPSSRARARRVSRRQLTAAIEALVEAGVRFEAIAHVLGVTRQAIYVRLKRHRDAAL